ncbi:hypothetical protein BQ8794_50220 [Mesorhizobium prunaredense]|uniref:Uncharacterized protein n=1 Tax=Mesorhizobium prunaredense TaxID=1631249 RepID=A0A1R3VDZ1_9HYPH|nr:hypothetical protein BQ8794_50220 [Mesorhizobium prunaredense]
MSRRTSARPGTEILNKRVTAFCVDSNLLRLCEMIFWFLLCFIGHTHLADLNLMFRAKASLFHGLNGRHRSDSW